MRRGTRVAAVVALATAAVLGAPAVAGAQVVDECVTTPTGYAPPPTCEMALQVEALCVDEVPVLRYAATVPGSAADDLDLTWLNPGGDDVAVTGLPLRGEVTWPGVTRDVDGRVVELPGWTRLDGDAWARRDAYAWTLDGVDVRFDVNPVAVATVQWPTAGVPCQGVTPVSHRQLAETGSEAVTPVAVAGGLVALGGVLLGGAVLSRRRAARR